MPKPLQQEKSDFAKHREVGPEARARRAALNLLHPLENRIHAWNIRTAWLIEIAAKLPEHDPRRPDVVQEIDVRLAEVRATRLGLAKEVAALPPAYARSSRLTDTDRALGSIATGLERAIGLLTRGDEIQPR